MADNNGKVLLSCIAVCLFVSPLPRYWFWARLTYTYSGRVCAGLYSSRISAFPALTRKIPDPISRSFRHPRTIVTKLGCIGRGPSRISFAQAGTGTLRFVYSRKRLRTEGKEKEEGGKPLPRRLLRFPQTSLLSLIVLDFPH